MDQNVVITKLDLLPTSTGIHQFCSNALVKIVIYILITKLLVKNFDNNFDSN